MLETAADAGSLEGRVGLNGELISFLRPFYESRGPTIYGGTVQIHRNILAIHARGLPAS